MRCNVIAVICQQMCRLHHSRCDAVSTAADSWRLWGQLHYCACHSSDRHSEAEKEELTEHA